MSRLFLGLLLILTLTAGNVNAAHYRSYPAHQFSAGVLSGNNQRPRAWCGWQMRQWHGGGPEYNLAKNWAHRGTGTVPGVGTIVVWHNHVGEITGYDSRTRQWIVHSGNDGHAVRERPRSIAGAIAFRRL